MPPADRKTMLGVLVTSVALAVSTSAQELPPPPAGNYTADPSHAIVAFSVNHLGLSDFVATFDSVEANLTIDPSDPETAQVTARIPVSSLDLPGGSAGFLTTMLGPAFFDAENYPEITYTSEKINLTSGTDAVVAGILSLLGEERSVSLNTRYNAGYGAGVFEPVARIGFSATAVFRRSDFGMDFGVPPEGSTIGVADQVSVQLEMEFVSSVNE